MLPSIISSVNLWPVPKLSSQQLYWPLPLKARLQGYNGHLLENVSDMMNKKKRREGRTYEILGADSKVIDNKTENTITISYKFAFCQQN